VCAWWHGVKLSKVAPVAKSISTPATPTQSNGDGRGSGMIVPWGRKRGKGGGEDVSRQSRRVRRPTFRLTWSSSRFTPLLLIFSSSFRFGVRVSLRSTLAGISLYLILFNWPPVAPFRFLSLIRKRLKLNYYSLICSRQTSAKLSIVTCRM